MSAVVGNLIEQIRKLSDEEREEFEAEFRILKFELLEQMLEPERAELRRQGFTQEDVDRAFDEVRAESRKQWREAQERRGEGLL